MIGGYYIGKKCSPIVSGCENILGNGALILLIITGFPVSNTQMIQIKPKLLRNKIKT